MGFDKNIKQLKWVITNLDFEAYEFTHAERTLQFNILLSKWLSWL